MRIWVDEESLCYENIHPDWGYVVFMNSFPLSLLLLVLNCPLYINRSVYDVSLWGTEPADTMKFHPGGPTAIRKWADGYDNNAPSAILRFPDWSAHPMWRWMKFSVSEERFGQYVGRFGDIITFDDLPEVRRLLCFCK